MDGLLAIIAILMVPICTFWIAYITQMHPTIICFFLIMGMFLIAGIITAILKGENK